MFSALRLGSTLYVLEKGEKHILKIGSVVSLTHPNYNNYVLNNSTLDINVKVDDSVIEFKNVPANASVHGDNRTFIAETRELMSNEVENILQNSTSIVESVPYHNNVILSCTEIQKVLNPRFAKELERDEEISNLKNKIGGMQTKIDKILNLLENK